MAEPVNANPRTSSPAQGRIQLRAQMESHPELPVADDKAPAAGLPPVTALRRFDTHRLLPAKYGSNYESVLTRIADDDSHLQAIFELDNATNARLEAEENRSAGMSPRELVFHVPHYRIINAAFTHPNPLGSRFSTSERGAWYAAFEIATAKAEVVFHKMLEFAEIDWTEREEVLYEEYLADFTGSFHDLREAPAFSACLAGASYIESQRLTVRLLEAGSLGVIYPSVRRPAGTCLACFRPSVVSNVRKGNRYRLVWAKGKARFEREGGF